MRVENDLGKDSVPKLVTRIAIPSLLAQFVSVLYSIVDRMYVGNIPEVGDISLAGVGICGPVVTMVGAFAFLVGIGGTPLMGISLGERNTERAHKILANCFLTLAVIAVALTAIILPLQKPMLYLFGASDVTYPYASRYFTIYISGTFFALMATGMNQFIISQGYAKVGMVSVMIGAVLNIVLDPVFIFLLDMGVAGAALATIISQAASAAFVLWYLISGRTMVKITFHGYDWKVIKQVIKLGLAPFSILAFDNVMIITMNAQLQRCGGAGMGDQLITVNTIVQSFMLLVTMPLGGISGGTQGILSYNYGACRADRIVQAERWIAGFCMGYTAIMFVLARTAGSAFASLFTSEAAINAAAVRAIGISTLAVVPLGLQYAIVDGFTGMGQVQVSLPLSTFRKAIYFISIFTLPAILNIDQIFYAEPISDVLGILASIAAFVFGMKKLLRERMAA